MNLPFAFALAIALAALAPIASASCVLSEREDLSLIAAATRDRVITNRGNEWGVYDVATGNVTLIGAHTDGLAKAVASPDGTWFAWEQILGDSPFTRDYDCAPLEGVFVGVKATDGAPERIDAIVEGRPRALAASHTQLAVVLHGADNITLYPWGERNGTNLTVDRAAGWARQGIMVDSDPWTARDVHLMRFSPDGTLLAVASWNDTEYPYGRRDITVVEVATGIPVGYASGWGFERALIDMAFTPDGTRLAIMTGEVERFVDVTVRDVATGETVARWVDTRAGVGLAWGAGGLAVALRETPLTGHGLENGTIVVLNGTLQELSRANMTHEHPRAIAWAGGDRIAMAMGGRIAIVNATGDAPVPSPGDRRVPLPILIVFAAAVLAFAWRRAPRTR